MILRGLCRAELRLAETDLFNINVVLNIPGLSLVCLIFLPQRHVHVPKKRFLNIRWVKEGFFMVS